MDEESDFDTYLLTHFEQISSSLANNNSSYKTELYMHYATLKLKLFWRWGRMEDLKEAVEKGKSAVAATIEEHETFASMLNKLGVILESLYERTGKMEDLEEAIRVARQAVKVTPEDHPYLAGCLNNLGNKLGRRYERTGKMEDLEEAIRVASKAWNCHNAVPFIRIQASSLAVQLLQILGDFERAYKLSRETINLLSYVHNRSLDHRDQQHIVSYFSGLATTACSLALQCGDSAETALEILEQGRGVILSLLIDDRSHASHLKMANPLLFERYESLRIRLNKPVKDFINIHLHETASKTRIDTIAEFEECVRDIQQFPGFEQFQKGLTAKQMQSCSAKGSIIVVNITELRSDAIIITTNGFKVLSFSASCARQAKDWINQDLTTTSQSDRGRKNKVYLQFLSWLWRECVKPVLDELHCYIQLSEDDKPRVWWIGTGLASSFPFHSANNSSVEPMESTAYRVVSSYIPTIKALQYARERVNVANLSCEDRRNVLIITMPQTPSAEALPGARAEGFEVMASIGSSASVETLELPDVAAAVARLQQCHIAHFACHGLSNPNDPSESGLILQTACTGTEEPRQDILNVRTACQAYLPHAEIAYLSACSTAQNRAVRLSDEVLHIVSGFQVAGFQHVIGCLWPSDDKLCVDIAKTFYFGLSQSGNMRYDDRSVALALHKAIMKIQESDEYRKRPLLWAQFVHFGA